MRRTEPKDKLNIFREGVVRDNRGLSTTPAFAWQILKNETHVCVFLVYAYRGLFYLLIVDPAE